METPERSRKYLADPDRVDSEIDYRSRSEDQGSFVGFQEGDNRSSSLKTYETDERSRFDDDYFMEKGY